MWCCVQCGTVVFISCVDQGQEGMTGQMVLTGPVKSVLMTVRVRTES